MSDPPLISPWLNLGSTLKRITDRLYASVDGIYEEEGVYFFAAWFPTFRALVERDGDTVSSLAARIQQSHAAVSQVSKKLEARGYVTSEAGDDRRQRQVMLTRGGRALAARLHDVWLALEAVLIARVGVANGDLVHCVSQLESEVAQEDFIEAVVDHARVQRRAAMSIVEFRPEHEDDALAFRELNEEWLHAYFSIEPRDEELLGDPQTHVLDEGGRILFASLHGELVGTCALIDEGDGVFELSKMAVTEPCRGLGVGGRLLDAVIREFRRSKGKRLFLESHSSLETAISLYERRGFEHARPHCDSPYARCDVYMEYRGP